MRYRPLFIPFCWANALIVSITNDTLRSLIDIWLIFDHCYPLCVAIIDARMNIGDDNTIFIEEDRARSSADKYLRICTLSVLMYMFGYVMLARLPWFDRRIDWRIGCLDWWTVKLTLSDLTSEFWVSHSLIMDLLTFRFWIPLDHCVFINTNAAIIWLHRWIW